MINYYNTIQRDDIKVKKLSNFDKKLEFNLMMLPLAILSFKVDLKLLNRIEKTEKDLKLLNTAIVGQNVRDVDPRQKGLSENWRKRQKLIDRRNRQIQR